MSASETHWWTAIRETARTEHDSRQNEPLVQAWNERLKGMPLAQMLDAEAFGAIEDNYPKQAMFSVQLEDSLVAWMRANPDAVAAIMRKPK
jgi:hypothetical protein